MSKKGLKGKDSHAKKIDRTGETTFNVTHDDGSVFECQVDDPKKFNSLKGVKGTTSKMHFFGGVGERKPLVCDSCKKRVHKVSISNGQSLCGHCV